MSSLLLRNQSSVSVAEEKLQPKKFVVCLERELKEYEKLIFKKANCVSYDADINDHVSLEELFKIYDIVLLDYKQKSDKYYLEKQLEYIKDNKIRIVVIKRRFINTTLDEVSDLVLKKLDELLLQKDKDELVAYLSRVRLRSAKKTLTEYIKKGLGFFFRLL